MHKVTRGIVIPDKARIGRYERTPEFGPSVLFFSGGTAINKFSRIFKSYTHNSIHLMTPFDSGGSSAELRKAFSMPAIGDLRSRLMALADESIHGMPDVYALFTYRLHKSLDQEVLISELQAMVKNDHVLINAISEPMRQLICTQLSFFVEHMPNDFDLRGASIGNLILAGGYLNNAKHIEPIIFLFSKLVAVCGTVKLIVNDNFHLVAELENEEVVIGQHKMTGKETCPISNPIKDLYLSKSINSVEPVTTKINDKNSRLIQSADLIVYPPGSFYSSIVANLLPLGVCESIEQNRGPKVYVPNLGCDPESIGMTTQQTIERLLSFLTRHNGVIEPSQVLTHVLLDNKVQCYNGAIDTDKFQQLGIQIIQADLISEKSAPYYDPQKLTHALLSFV